MNGCKFMVKSILGNYLMNNVMSIKSRFEYVKKIHLRRRYFLKLLVASLSVWLIAQPAYADISVVIEASERAVLSAESAGVITKFSVAAGDSVKAGQTVAVLDTKELNLDVARKKKGLNFLYKKITNLKKLVERGLATDQEIGEMRLERDLLRTELELLKYRIARSTIKAPFNGSVVQKLAQKHEWAQVGQPIVELINKNALRVVADVPSDVGNKMNAGDEITIYIPVLQTNITAKLNKTAPEVDVKSNTLRVYAQVQSPPKDLLSGMAGVWKTNAVANGATKKSNSNLSRNNQSKLTPSNAASATNDPERNDMGAADSADGEVTRQSITDFFLNE